METTVFDTIRSTTVFGRIYGVNQFWEPNSKWSCIGTPRRKHGFMYILCDSVHITYANGEKSSFNNGQLIYIPKRCEYEIVFVYETERRGRKSPQDIVVNFDMRELNGKERALADKIISISDNISPRTEALLKEIIRTCFDLKTPHLRVSSIFYSLLEELSTIPATEKAGNPKADVLPAVRYLDTHITENVSIPELASMCLMSVTSFRKHFRDYTGMSPVEYRMYTKIAKAKQLLRNSGEMSVKEIAISLGFCESSYFHRVFYDMTGKTPSQYRNEQE